MSTSPGGDDLPAPSGAIAGHFANPSPPPDWSNRDEVIDYIVEEFRPFNGALPFDADEVRAVAGIVVDRTIDIEASMTNHWLLAGGDEPLRPRLGHITAPTLVIHGTDDPVFPPPHAEALAREIPGRLLVIEGMGHEVPPRPVWDQVVAAILEHTQGAD
jgi:pimeloyl-ACP methyl ester carboxylesterase